MRASSKPSWWLYPRPVGRARDPSHVHCCYPASTVSICLTSSALRKGFLGATCFYRCPRIAEPTFSTGTRVISLTQYPDPGRPHAPFQTGNNGAVLLETYIWSTYPDGATALVYDLAINGVLFQERNPSSSRWPTRP